MEIKPVTAIDGTRVAYLDVSDIDIPNREAIESLLTFRINTYNKLKDQKRPGIADDGLTDWDKVFLPINRFFMEMTKEDKTVLANGILIMKKKILDFFMTEQPLTDLNRMLRDAASVLDAIDQEIDLCGKIRKYVDENIVVGLKANAGKRAQDTEEMTFYPENVYDLTTVTLLCKIMTPLYGTLIEFLTKRVDPIYRDVHCAVLVSTVLDRRYRALIEKLQHYIRRTIDRAIKEDTSILIAGYSLETLAYHMYTSLLVRKFVNVDLCKNDGKNNLITFILVSVWQNITSVRTEAKKHPTYDRVPIMSKHEDDGNTSQLEIDSITSRKTMDTGALVQFAVHHAIKDTIRQYSLDEENVAAVLRFYAKNPIVPNIINRNMNAMFYGKAIGGAQGLAMLHIQEYTELTAILQMVIFSLDTNHEELGHMMTAGESVNAVDVANGGSLARLKTGSENNPAYRTVRKMFDENAFGIRGRDWDEHVSEINNYLSMHRFTYNTANFLWNWMDKDNRNREEFSPTEMTVIGMCNMYELIMTMTEGI